MDIAIRIILAVAILGSIVWYMHRIHYPKPQRRRDAGVRMPKRVFDKRSGFFVDPS